LSSSQIAKYKEVANTPTFTWWAYPLNTCCALLNAHVKVRHGLQGPDARDVPRRRPGQGHGVPDGGLRPSGPWLRGLLVERRVLHRQQRRRFVYVLHPPAGRTHAITALYKNYIDQIVTQIKAFPTVPVVAVVEPDSLGNLVTNMVSSTRLPKMKMDMYWRFEQGVTKCANAASVYKSSIVYAMQQLNTVGVHMYLDAGHAG
jgi:hypothetical protein